MELLVKNAYVYRDHRFQMLDFLIRKGKIVAMMPGMSADAIILDAKGLRCVPGFLDIHTHGGVMVDANAAEPKDIEKLASFFARHGTTGFLLSVLTDSIQLLIGYLSQQ